MKNDGKWRATSKHVEPRFRCEHGVYYQFLCEECERLKPFKKRDEIVKFIGLIRNSFVGAEVVYSEGSCFQLYKIIAYVWPEAIPWHYASAGHVYTEIDGRYYDIKGELTDSEIINQLVTLEESLPIGANPEEWKYEIKM